MRGGDVRLTVSRRSDLGTTIPSATRTRLVRFQPICRTTFYGGKRTSPRSFANPVGVLPVELVSLDPLDALPRVAVQGAP